ncbi:MAG: glycosyltransferase [Lachnospiraceae bacterium]|nr:glycosyltransferase [Lachnospiraceae bacterium]
MISIIVPIYKVEQFLPRCIDSILGQTFSDFELILVDDGSPDHCGEICDQYETADSRIRVIHKENGGLSDARNAGLEVAQGDYICFVDSDDWVAPQYLEKLLRNLKETDADICECGAYYTSGESCDKREKSQLIVFNTEQALRELIQDGQLHQYVWNKLYRRDVIGDIFFVKGKTNEDEFWTYQIFGRAKRVTKISDILYNYYQRSDSIMGMGFSLKRLDALEAKTIRQDYLERYFPELRLEAKINLYFSCVYAGQMTLRYLSCQEKKMAKEQIDQYVNFCKLQKDEVTALTGGSKLWYRILRKNFWLGCKLRNLTGRGF